MASISLQNSCATFGDKVNVHSDLILVPNQNLSHLCTAVPELLNAGPNSRSSSHANKDPTANTPPVLKKGHQGSRFTQKTALWTVIFLLAVVIVISLTVLLFKEPDYGHFVSRKQWRAIPRSPSCDMDKYVKKPSLVIVQHTSTEKCLEPKECILKVQSMQRHHLEKKFCEVGYNFLVGGDGRVYEGRGFDYIGAHTLGYNGVSLGLGFIGEFVSIHPTEAQLQWAKNFLEDAARQGHLPSDFKVAGACQVNRTLSPGAKLMDDLMTWKDRFTFDPDGVVGRERPSGLPLLGYCAATQSHSLV